MPNIERQDASDHRFDYLVQSRFANCSSLMNERERIIADCLIDPEIARFALSHKIPALTSEDDKDAFRAIVDYFFEKEVMRSMNMIRQRSHLANLSRSVDCYFETEPKRDQPLILESIHHVCSFSTNYIFITNLIADFNFRKIILLHQNESLDVRAQAVADIVSADFGVPSVSIVLQGNWYKQLRDQVDSRTIVATMGDMPPSLFASSPKSLRIRTKLRLLHREDQSICHAGYSIARRLKDQLGGQHGVIDYPGGNIARFWIPGEETIELQCPLVDWLFWPALHFFERTAVD